jgi:hypothetical protein
MTHIDYTHCRKTLYSNIMSTTVDQKIKKKEKLHTLFVYETKYNSTYNMWYSFSYN